MEYSKNPETNKCPLHFQLSLCERHNNPNNIMSRLLTSSGPFLFPCTIEYSLICAAVLFVMWKHIDEEHSYYVEQKRRRKISRVSWSKFLFNFEFLA